MSLCLTHEEIKELTEKSKYSAQRRVLRALGLDFKPRTDGTDFVDRSIYEMWLNGGRRKKSPSEDEMTQPKWSD